MNFRNSPIQRKLMSIILLTCSVVLTLMCCVYIFFEFITFRQAVKNNVSTLGVIIASNSSAALAFDSQADANEILSALDADKHIVAACLYDRSGKLFAKYPDTISSNALPAQPGKSGYRIEGAFLAGFQPVMQHQYRLGTLYIRSDLEAMYGQLKKYIIIALFLIAGSLFVAYLLSIVLQKAISKPIIALEQTASIISQKRDYSIRATKMGGGEVGSLTDAFNQMLAQIEAQNLEIIKAREESLQLAAIVESSGDAIIGNDLSGRITSWNLSAERMLGYTAGEMIGQPVSAIMPPEKQKEEARFAEYLKKGEQVESFETQFITRDNNLLDISLTVSAVKDASGNIIGLSKIARDISKQKENERQLVQSEEHLRLATQAAELGTFDMDVVNNILSCDTRCRELLCIAHNDPSTFNEQILKRLHRDDLPRINRVMESAFNRSLDDGNYDVEYRIVDTDDKIRWLRAKGRVFFNDEDKPVRFIGAILDVTDKKQEEIRKNDFIAIISHELKTPLTSIKAYVQILLVHAKKHADTFCINALTRAEAQANKMGAMIKDFLSLARIEEGKIQIVKEVFDLSRLMEDVVADAVFLNSGHTIKLLAADAVNVNADRDKIGQVLNNLLSNAMKYSSPNSTITVGYEKQADEVRVYISDEGIGISSRDQKKLFERFYRVENEKIKTVSGFGIGLYLVSEILRHHNSHIMVESTEGKGSTFYFNLEAFA
ncbi:PAS domain S-box protein (plasmid) [Pedobacter sp. BS3]|uniref:PAS domain S-box protein n=1 Tax=Pedobacter sp. BS3 TaxID=2567937 RepID=UPI0011EEC55C|nr:PAS domain S-box protein [Pedobacter sp. BS3]TZF86404.1 PAS domain S-box protein [Pedobacter sp. BS3]